MADLYSNDGNVGSGPSAGKVGINTSSPDYQLDVRSSSGTNTINSRQENNTTGTENARFRAVVGGASGGNPYLHLAITGAAEYAIGMDNSVDGDPLTITKSGTLGTTNKAVYNKGFEITEKGTSDSCTIKVVGGEGQTAALLLHADEGDDNADKSRIIHGTAGKVEWQHYSTGAWVTKMDMSSAGITIY